MKTEGVVVTRYAFAGLIRLEFKHSPDIMNGRIVATWVASLDISRAKTLPKKIFSTVLK